MRSGAKMFMWGRCNHLQILHTSYTLTTFRPKMVLVFPPKQKISLFKEGHFFPANRHFGTFKIRCTCGYRLNKGLLFIIQQLCMMTYSSNQQKLLSYMVRASRKLFREKESCQPLNLRKVILFQKKSLIL